MDDYKGFLAMKGFEVQSESDLNPNPERQKPLGHTDMIFP